MTVSNEIRELVLASVAEYVSVEYDTDLAYIMVRPHAKTGRDPVSLRQFTIEMIEKAPLGISSVKIANGLGVTGNPLYSEIAAMVRSLLELEGGPGAPSDPVRAKLLAKRKSNPSSVLIDARKAAIDRAKAAIAAKAAAQTQPS